MTTKKLSYKSSGVDYDLMDPFKKLAQEASLETIKALFPKKYMQYEDVLGDSAFIHRHYYPGGSFKVVFVVEGLGTKNLVADEVYKTNNRSKSYYDVVAYDTVAAIVNDLITVGAEPFAVNAYFGMGSSDWLKDTKRAKDLIRGWKEACLDAEALYGGGETPTLPGIISPETVDLAGSAVGIIHGEEIYGHDITSGDAILLIESSGIHANGLTLARKVAEKLGPDRYNTILPNETITYGEALLTRSHLYVKLVKKLLEAKIHIHYMVHITGHGWRKLMRAKKDFTYLINNIPDPSSLFKFIQKQANLSDEEMYGTFNMGAGFAIILPQDRVEKAQNIATALNLASWNAGVVQNGPKRVIIKTNDLDITFKSESLNIR